MSIEDKLRELGVVSQTEGIPVSDLAIPTTDTDRVRSATTESLQRTILSIEYAIELLKNWDGSDPCPIIGMVACLSLRPPGSANEDGTFRGRDDITIIGQPMAPMLTLTQQLSKALERHQQI